MKLLLAAQIAVFLPLLAVAEIVAPHEGRGEAEVGQVAVRCAFDIGSGSTKIKVAKVDAALDKIVHIIFESETKVPYKAMLTKENTLPNEILVKGAEAMERLRKEAAEKIAGPGKRLLASDKPLACQAVAGTPFREAGNRKAALDMLSSKTGIPISLLNQEEEAVIGVLAVFGSVSQRLNRDVPPLDLVVWDIGGANMQLTILKQGARAGTSQRFIIHKESLASETLKRHLIDKIQNKPEGTRSPNPITKVNGEAALKYVKSVAAKVIPEIKARLDTPGVQVIGIGPVHGKSILGQAGIPDNGSFTQERIAELLKQRYDWPDAKVGGAYADTQISNLILVLGFMQQLKISEVTALDINLTEGVLVNPKFWLSE